jgi:hypothetical protein
MRISHEPIYLSLFVQSRCTLRRELTARRRLHGCPLAQGRGQIPASS